VAQLITAGAADRLTLALTYDGASNPQLAPAAQLFDAFLEWPVQAMVLVEDTTVLDSGVAPAAAAARRTGQRSLLAVPIAGAGGPIGSLILGQRRPGAFDQAALVVAAALARRAGAVIEQEHLVSHLQEHTRELEREIARLQHLAVTDSLTGLANRRAYDACLQREWRRAQRHRTPLSLMLIDIDQFKRYNDTYGHAAGDACLRRVAAVVGKVVHRPGDLAARYGGEEYVIVAAETSSAEAGRLAEVVRAGVEALGIVHLQSDVAPHVTVSVGVATIIPRRHHIPAVLLTAADTALYAAKRAGGNRVLGGTSLDHEGGMAAGKQ
jgi:diguanylate cyclase (GGDEF)-like protein